MTPDFNKRIIDVISGKENGLAARLCRIGLGFLAFMYGSVVAFRNRSFNRRPGRIHKMPVAVISVGNLTTGGTGKSPVVRWLTHRLTEMGHEPGIVSRGYGSRDGEPNDEYRELKLFLPDVPHIQNPDRVAAAQSVIRQHGADVVVADDGFQHRRLGRDLDIVLVDATNPFGFGHLIPKGLLREPVKSLARADAVIITRVDQVSDVGLQKVIQQIEEHVPTERIATMVFQPGDWLDVAGKPVQWDPNSPVVGFCGIGNPESFRRTLESELAHFENGNLADFVAFPDHHLFETADIDRLKERARKHQDAILACTVKDLVKLVDQARPDESIRALTTKAVFQTGREMIEALVCNAIQC